MNASRALRFLLRCAFINSYLAAHQSCVMAVAELRMSCSSQSESCNAFVEIYRFGNGLHV
jgi:hypothetical protein